jgi:hypothetical protein
MDFFLGRPFDLRSLLVWERGIKAKGNVEGEN